MTPPILGIFASAVTGGVSTTSYESIATVTVGSGGAANIEFTSIPGTYTHLQIRSISKNTNSVGAPADIRIQFNSDTGTNYARHGFYGSGSAVSQYATTSLAYCDFPLLVAASDSANIFGAGVIDILDYANANKYKTVRTLAGLDSNGASGQNFILFMSALWLSTSAITSIKITSNTANFAQYSHFALYGCKSA